MARAAAVRPASHRERHGLHLVSRPLPEGTLSPEAQELQTLLSGLSPSDFRKALDVVRVYVTRGKVSDKQVETWLGEIESGRAHILEL